MGKGVIKNLMELRTNIMSDNDFFCEAAKSKPTSFWTRVLRKYDDIDVQIKEMVQVALTMPLGSASAERSFSVMNWIKPKSKSQMKPELLNALAFLRMNGPRVSQLNVEQYTIEYIGKGNLICNPPVGSTSTFD